MRAAQDQNDLNIEGTMLNISRSVFCKDLWLVVRRLDLSAQRRTPPPHARLFHPLSRTQRRPELSLPVGLSCTPQIGSLLTTYNSETAGQSI